MGLDLDRLRVLLAVVERGGYSAAGRHLGIAQATVSHHVRQLEEELGTQLLRYENRTVQLTAAGEEVLRSARLLVQQEEQLRASLRDLDQGRRGRVRLGATMAFEQRYFFDRVVAPFHRAHDGILLSLRFGHSRRQAQAVQDDELDLAYVIDWHLPPEVAFEPLHEAELRFLVPDGHPLTRRSRVTVDDITDVGLITAPLDSIEALYYHQLLGERGFSTHRPVLEVDGIQARLLAAHAGLGVVATFYPDNVGDGAYQGLVPLPVEGSATRVEVGLVRPADARETPGVAALTAWLHDVAPTTARRPNREPTATV